MINNVKVRPVLKVEGELDRSFKAGFANLEEEQLQLVVILPAAIPDSIILSTAEEARMSLE